MKLHSPGNSMQMMHCPFDRVPKQMSHISRNGNLSFSKVRKRAKKKKKKQTDIAKLNLKLD